MLGGAFAVAIFVGGIAGCIAWVAFRRKHDSVEAQRRALRVLYAVGAATFVVALIAGG